MATRPSSPRSFAQNPLGGFSGSSGGGAIWISISLTLYKVQTSIYLLDFQKTDGSRDEALIASIARQSHFVFTNLLSDCYLGL